MIENVSHETHSLPENIARQIEARALGRRKLVRHGKTLCSGCYEPIESDRHDAYCKACRAGYSAGWRRRQAAELKRLKELAGER